jgi:hypothetical protein
VITPDELAIILIVFNSGLLAGIIALLMARTEPNPKPRYRRHVNPYCDECGLISDRMKSGLCEWCRGVKG